MTKRELRVWLQALYEAFVLGMLDVLPDFPNCCYQVSGAVAQMLLHNHNLKNLKVVYGGYSIGESNLHHGWVKAQSQRGENLIIDFAHLQFEIDVLPEDVSSFSQLLYQQKAAHIPFSGKVVFFEEDPEYRCYIESGG